MLAGGRSQRMGSPKADLDWHGSTLAYRVTALLQRATDGPVVVVRAPGQTLPDLPAGAMTAQDAVADRGPMQGIAAGLAALDGVADVAFVAAVDQPLIRPEFVAGVLDLLEPEVDVVLPLAGGRNQPLSAAYRVALAPLAAEIAAGERRGTAQLFDRVRVRALEADAHAESMTSVNDPETYERSLALPLPRIIIEGEGVAEAATLGALRNGGPVEINGVGVPFDERTPLVDGDVVQFG